MRTTPPPPRGIAGCAMRCCRRCVCASCQQLLRMRIPCRKGAPTSFLSALTDTNLTGDTCLLLHHWRTCSLLPHLKEKESSPSPECAAAGAPATCCHACGCSAARPLAPSTPTAPAHLQQARNCISRGLNTQKPCWHHPVTQCYPRISLASMLHLSTSDAAWHCDCLPLVVYRHM